MTLGGQGWASSERSAECTGRPPGSALEALEPLGGGGVVSVGGSAWHPRFGAVRARIAAEEDNIGADPVESHQRLGQPRIGDMAFGVDRETVVAQGALCRPGLDPAEVHTSAGELLQDLQQ